ncbi:hypothetical protein DACRYDRAFT_21077 [Dacryopinax primogenitus]|uniref:Uncharacterized protein n=1 Tax=Dacryopinax primogenitus (strain DJM 731) TaxID=1858805 RepID=M5GER6_DACPD|nr:uncharacterized protein DACRYDRAFT_21077 [Dacryopinax primogenitus]EJU03513.1 hypothetical protein DACRYDRAFT_21077 [Dacryopinax primogenitus]
MVSELVSSKHLTLYPHWGDDATGSRSERGQKRKASYSEPNVHFARKIKSSFSLNHVPPQAHTCCVYGVMYASNSGAKLPAKCLQPFCWRPQHTAQPVQLKLPAPSFSSSTR